MKEKTVTLINMGNNCIRVENIFIQGNGYCPGYLPMGLPAFTKKIKLAFKKDKKGGFNVRFSKEDSTSRNNYMEINNYIICRSAFEKITGYHTNRRTNFNMSIRRVR